jgi:hypothetical protein
MFQTATFRKLIGLPGGDTGEDDAVVRAVFARSGAHVMGRHMFEEGELGWPRKRRSMRPYTCSRTLRASHGRAKAGPRSTSSPTA